MVLWRISNHASLMGDGALRVSGRWHTRGRRVVYCAETPAAALLEILVHLEIDIEHLPVRYRLLRIEVPVDVVVERVSIRHLPPDWIERPDATRVLGDTWLAEGRSLLLAVPSALVPETFNLLLNPDHAGAGRVGIAASSDHVSDPRLLKGSRSILPPR